MGNSGKQLALASFLSKVARKLGVGKHVYVVGGAVRDFVLGMPIKDIDMVIDSVALKGKGSEWFARQLQSFIPAQTKLVTNNYGVAILTVVGSWESGGYDFKGEVIEIANAREESYGGEAGKGYKPSEVSAADIEKDVYRREFTFNTLMWRLSDLAKGPDRAQIIDITGCGLRDLKQGEMSCPSSPDKTFKDDPTRMLRAIKFLVRYDWKISNKVKISIRKNAHLLKKVPADAVVKLLVGDILKEQSYKKALKEMKDLGLLSVVNDMAGKNKQMRSTLQHWASGKKVQFMLDLMDAGVPLGANIRFLSPVQQKQFRGAVIGLKEGEAEKLLAVLKQPGKVMDTRMLMHDLGVKGKEVSRLSDIARAVLLDMPVLMRDPQRLTQKVKKEFAKLKESRASSGAYLRERKGSLAEIEFVGPGKWITTDGRFGVIKKFRPINPMESSELPGKRDRHVFSVRDLRNRTYTGLFYELSPELYQARRFKDVVPWIREFDQKDES